MRPRILQAQAVLAGLQLAQNVTTASELHRVGERGRRRLHPTLNGDDTIGLARPIRLALLREFRETRRCAPFGIEDGWTPIAISAHENRETIESETSESGDAPSDIENLEECGIGLRPGEVSEPACDGFALSIGD